VDAKKMLIAGVVGVAAIAASMAAMAHSRQILTDEQHIYPDGTLQMGDLAEVDGCSIRISEPDVVSYIASADTRGYDRVHAKPDHAFLRLTLSIRNNTDKPVDVGQFGENLRVVHLGLRQPVETELHWLRWHDALPNEELAPGESTGGKVALHIFEFHLNDRLMVEIKQGAAVWGVDVVDRGAPVQ